MRNTFQKSKDASSVPYLRCNSAKRFQWQFDLRFFSMARYHQCGRGISMYQQSQLQPTDAQAQWLVYHSWLYGGDTIISGTPKLVWNWLSKSCQPIVRYWYVAKYRQSPSFMSPMNWGWAHYPDCITAIISFERNACPRRVQK
jgi:hypothetical protein